MEIRENPVPIGLKGNPGNKDLGGIFGLDGAVGGDMGENRERQNPSQVEPPSWR